MRRWNSSDNARYVITAEQVFEDCDDVEYILLEKFSEEVLENPV